MGEIQSDTEKMPKPWVRRQCQLSIFHNGLRFDTKMLLDATISGTMIVVDAEHATKRIDASTSTNYQAQNDRQTKSKKGMIDRNALNALLAQNQILT